MPREFPKLFWIKADAQGYGERWYLAAVTGSPATPDAQERVSFLEPWLQGYYEDAKHFQDETKFPVVPALPPHSMASLGDLTLLWRTDAPTPEDGVIAAVCEYYDATSRAFLHAEVHQGYVADGHRDLVSADINSDVLVATEEITRWLPLADYLRFCGCPHT